MGGPYNSDPAVQLPGSHVTAYHTIAYQNRSQPIQSPVHQQKQQQQQQQQQQQTSLYTEEDGKMAEKELEHALAVNEEILRLKRMEMENIQQGIRNAVKNEDRQAAKELLKKRSLVEAAEKGMQTQVDNLQITLSKIQQVQTARVTHNANIIATQAIKGAMGHISADDVERVMEDLGECFDDVNETTAALSKGLYLDAVSDPHMLSDAALDAEFEEEMEKLKEEKERQEREEREEHERFQSAFPQALTSATMTPGVSRITTIGAKDDAADDYLRASVEALFS